MVTINQNSANNNSSINFLETLTVEQFKEQFDCTKIDIIRNPKSGKFFFSYATKLGRRTGKVSTRGKGQDGRILNPVISKLDEVDPNTGENVWMIHEEGGIESLQTL